MDIFRFIDSRDIREHLQRLNYRFTAPEAAFLVYECATVTMKEKFAAWREIIDTMPNCFVPTRQHMEAIPDFHEFLKKYIELCKKDIKRFKESKGCIYTFSIPWRDGDIGPFSSFERCLAAAMKEPQIDDGDRICITKSIIDPGENIIAEEHCTLTTSGEIRSLRRMYDRDTYDLRSAFDKMWFDFPTPFHSGDIVCSFSNSDRPFVLCDICTWDTERLRKELPVSEYSEEYIANRDAALKKLNTAGGITDMYCRTYAVRRVCEWTNPGPYIEFNDYLIYSYLNLEYYRGTLTGFYKVLQPISDFLKQWRSLESLLNTYSCLLQAAFSERQSDIIRFRTKHKDTHIKIIEGR